MVTQQKATGRASSIPAGLAAGAAVSILMTLLICLIGGWMIGSELISQQQIGYCSIVALLTSAILGSLTAWKKIRRKRLLVCMVSGLAYFVILAIITLIFFDGGYQGMGVTLITILVGAAVSVLLTDRPVKSKTGKRRKKIYR